MLLHYSMLCQCDVGPVELHWCPTRAMPRFMCYQIHPATPPARTVTYKGDWDYMSAVEAYERDFAA